MGSTIIDVKRVAAALEVVICKIDRAEPFALAVASAGIGRRQLERHFKNLGTTPHREVSRVRLELAVGQLTSKHGASAHLEGVSRRVGYRDPRRLREVVSRAYGLSPREIRQGARIERNLRIDEEMRAKWRGSGISMGVWRSAYRRRRCRETLQRLLRKANAEGEKIILGQVVYPRPAEARENASELARRRALQLYAATREEMKRVA